MTKMCKVCGREFAGRGDAAFCSNKCRQFNYRDSRKKGFVYIILNKSNGLIKIGKADDVDFRVGDVTRIGGITDFEYCSYGPFKNPLKVELSMHDNFARDRVIGEWFESDYKLASEFLKVSYNVDNSKKVTFSDELLQRIGFYNAFLTEQHVHIKLLGSIENDFFDCIAVISRVYGAHFRKVDNMLIVMFANKLFSVNNINRKFNSIIEVALAVKTFRDNVNEFLGLASLQGSLKAC